MRIKLAQRWIDLLINAPESGMGYQRVDVRFADGRHVENVIVFNAENLEVPDMFAGADVQDLKLHRAEPSARISDA